jgi:DNA-binding NtrC family response regulator
MRVLLVDDDETILVTAAALLEDDFDVTTSASALEALTRLRSSHVDVLCTDFHMRGMNGLDLVKRVAERDPTVSCVLITGHLDFLRSQAGQASLSFSILLKPYTPADLLERVKSATRLTLIKRSLHKP